MTRKRFLKTECQIMEQKNYWTDLDPSAQPFLEVKTFSYLCGIFCVRKFPAGFAMLPNVNAEPVLVNSFYCGKSITKNDVSVCRSNHPTSKQHETCFLPSLFYFSLPYYSTLSDKRISFCEKCYWALICVQIFSTKNFWKFSHSERISEKCFHKYARL
jgi:hypothetical protein